MAFNVSEILSAINSNGGLSKASKFVVFINPPPSTGLQSDNDLVFFCESALLPGIALQTDDVKMKGYGNVERRPHNVAFSDLPLTFYNDTDGKVLGFFHKWMQSIYNFDSGSSPYATVQNLAPNIFAYPKDYRGTISLYHMDDLASGYTTNTESLDGAQTIVRYDFNFAFPISIQDVQLSWDASDTLVRIPVTFTYTNWVSTVMSGQTVDERSQARASSLSSVQSTIDEDLKLATELLSVEKPQLQYQTNYYAQYLSYY